MTEVVLPNVVPVTPQSTGWWCGPASARIVLASKGIHVPEAELAREIGTHTGGTDHIGWITDRSLRHRAPQAGYAGVPLHTDPPTPAQGEALWEHLRRSVNAGWGLVVNWVAPPGNYPIGIKGSTSPSYGGGTIYHYVTYMGYDENPSGRAVFVADPGFRPFSFWISWRQAQTLIPPKAYAWASSSAAVAPPPVVTPPPAPAADRLELLIAAMAPTTVSRQRFTELLPAFAQALDQAKCHNLERAAMFCAQLGHESGGLRYMAEIHDGSNYEGRQDLGNTQPGDGRRFKGRGPIQITGRSNYTALSRWSFEQGYTSSPTYFVDHPERLESDREGFLGAVWYWTVARPNINPMSDRRDLEGVTRAINGGLNGLQDRRNRWNNCLGMGDRLLGLKTTAAPPGEGFLMALTDDEQREVLALLRILADDRTASISPFRHLGSEQHGAVTMPRRVDFVDANLHFLFALALCQVGDPEHLRLVTEVAGALDDPRYPDRQTDAKLARRVLDYLAEMGHPAPEILEPAPPPFVCSITDTDRCAGAGGAETGRCLITPSGVCVAAEWAAGQAR